MSYFTTSDSYQIYYEEYGQEHEETILFVHGHGGRTGYFRHQMEGLRDRYHVVAFDLRGHGQSEKRVLNLDMLRLGEDIHELIGVLQLHKPTIVGWSLGSNVVLAYLLQHGYDNVTSIVTIDNSPKMINDEKWEYGAFKNHREALDFWENSFKSWRDYAGNFVPAFFGEGPRDEDDYKFVEETYPDNNNDFMIPILISNNTIDFRPALRDISVPYAIYDHVWNQTFLLCEGDHHRDCKYMCSGLSH